MNKKKPFLFCKTRRAAYVNTVRLRYYKYEDTEKTEVRKYAPSLSQERAGRCEP